MPYNTQTWSFDRAFSFGLPKLLMEVRDSVSAPPTVEAMRQLGGWEEDPGGTTIVRPLRHSALSVQVVPDNPLSVTEPNAVTDIMSAANYPWAMIWAEIVIDERDIAMLSNNPAQAVKFIREHAQAATRDFYKAMDTALFATSNNKGTKTELGSFYYYLDGDNATGSFVGNIAKSNSFWQATQWTSVGAISITALDTHLVTLASQYSTPHIAVSTPAIISKIRSLLQANERVVNVGGQRQEFGALAVEYAGCLLVADALCNAGTIYYVNLDGIKWFVDKNEPSVKEAPTPLPVRKYSIAMNCQLTAASLKDSGRATGVTV